MKFSNPNLSKTEVLTVLLKLIIVGVSSALLEAVNQQMGWGGGILDGAVTFCGGVLSAWWVMYPYLSRAKPEAVSDEAADDTTQP
jgi:hypothetical protein